VLHATDGIYTACHNNVPKKEDGGISGCNKITPGNRGVILTTIIYGPDDYFGSRCGAHGAGVAYGHDKGLPFYQGATPDTAYQRIRTEWLRNQFF
jgi:hypothetical protein